MTIEQIDSKLKELSTTCSVDQAKALVDGLVALLGINETKNKELLTHRSIDREVTRFVSAPMLRNQAAAYNIPHESGEPIDLKLFWVKNTTKANLSWLVALTPNYEDDPENNENANLGIDFVLSESCDRLYIILSYKLKLRVLELHEALSHTQKEILDSWTTIRRELDPASDTYKEQLRSHLWNSFDFEPVNKLFYSKLIEQFDHLVAHLKETIPEEEAKMFAVKLFGRTLFLWFLKKKEFLNPKINYFKVKGEDDQTKYYQDFLEPLFFEVLNSEIRGRKYPDEITPFLNGGLFEPTETDFYKDSNLTFPDGFFTQFYSLLNKFNFTVDEGTSDYEQVAVDPEMLGRVFENLLASINPETETSARKAKGAFYTPRTIVDYMCEQSLIEYLKTKLSESPVRDQRIEELVTMNESDFREQDHNKRRDWKRDLGKEEVIKALDELRVLDPAVGSGAFPMGMLQLLVKVYSRIETANEKDLAGLKREILSRSLYGVDIDQMAIQISRLRAWLSILVDMHDLRKVEPLPNLDFKFVCANTLIPLAAGTQDNLFDEHQLKEDLIEIRDKYYEATKKVDKKKLRDHYIEKIQDGGLFAELESERQRQLKDYNPFDSLNTSEFYDPSLMHGVDSFEIVIGNPPYNEVSDQLQKEYFQKEFKDVLSGHYDLYIFFIHSAYKILTDDGVSTFIIPHSYLEYIQFENLRRFLYQNTNLIEISDRITSVFDSAVVDNSILIYKKSTGRNFKTKFSKKVSDQGLNEINNTLLNRGDFNHSNFSIEGIRNSKILDKFLDNSEPLGEITKSTQGITVYAKVQGEKINWFREKEEDDDSKQYLKGRDINRYEHRWVNQFIQYGEWLWCQRKKVFFESPKIILRQTSDRIIATYIEQPFYAIDSVHVFIQDDPKYSLKYLLGYLNSKLANYLYGLIINERGKVFAQVKLTKIRQVPVPRVSDSNSIIIEEIEEIVDKILQKKNNNSDTSTFEDEIDELVMNLYNLNEEEKETIRNS